MVARPIWDKKKKKKKSKKVQLEGGRFVGEDGTDFKNRLRAVTLPW